MPYFEINVALSHALDELLKLEKHIFDFKLHLDTIQYVLQSLLALNLFPIAVLQYANCP